jgi:hypothetical protein
MDLTATLQKIGWRSLRMDSRLYDQLQVIIILGPVVGLFLLGLFVSLRSGDVRSSGLRGLRLLLSNLSQVLLRVAGYVVCLLAVQYMVGFPLGLAW